MQFSSLFSIAALAAAAQATTMTVAYDQTYDNGAGSLDSVSCSDGANGLITRYGWTTFDQVSRFPNIGAAAAVGGWNSPACGTCWKLTYNGKSIFVLAVDHAVSGFNIALDAMNTLTNGNAVQFGRVNADATQVAVSNCGLSH